MSFEQLYPGADEMARAIETVLVGSLAVQPDAARRGTGALRDILNATEQHYVDEMLEGEASARVVRLLGRLKNVAATGTNQALDDIARADAGVGSEVLDRLFDAGMRRGRLTTEPRSQGVGVLVQVDGQWCPTGWFDWLDVLAQDWRSLRDLAAEAHKAIERERTHLPGPDWLRQFRELARDPTRERLARIVDTDLAPENLEVAGSAIRRAIRDLGLFGGGVPADWFERVADDPLMVARIARQVGSFLSRAAGPRGRNADASLNGYAERVVEIFLQMTGIAISYAKSKPPSNAPYGPALDYMVAALRLIDPGLGAHSAVYQIDRIRKRNKESRS